MIGLMLWVTNVVNLDTDERCPVIPVIEAVWFAAVAVVVMEPGFVEPAGAALGT